MFICARAEATTSSVAASVATACAFWRNLQADMADDMIRIPAASIGRRTTRVSSSRTPGCQ